MPSSILPVTARPDTVRIPSDPSIAFTPEQDRAFWGGDVCAMLRDCEISARRDQAYIDRLIARLPAPQRHTHPTPLGATMLEKAQANGR